MLNKISLIALDFREYWKRQVKRLQKRGLFWVFQRAFLKIARLGVGILLQPIALVAHLCGFRTVNIHAKYIGHLTSEIDCLVKLMSLNLIPRKIYFATIVSDRVSNPCLLNYWKQYIPILSNPILKYLVSAASTYGLMKLNTASFIATEEEAAQYYEINALWGKRPPLLALSDMHRNEGLKALSRLGMPQDAWYVCLHVREGGYAPDEEDLHSYRNGNIEHCRTAIDTIASHGGWVIRMGDPSMRRINNLPNLIDYAHSSEKADWMDVFLCATCRFFVGNTSGLFLVSTSFGVPCVLVNMTPFAAPSFGYKDLYIPKLLRDKKNGKLLPFFKIMRSPIANFRRSYLFQTAGLEVVENSSEDINDLVEEALLRVNDQWIDTPEMKTRQTQFKKLFHKHHYGYYSSSRIGSVFLTKYLALLSGE